MKISICSIFLCISIFAFSQEKQAIPKNKLEANLSFSIHSNGFAPIPSFSLDKPALFASINLSKGKFSYDPILAYNFEGKPWFIDNWFHYKTVVKPKFELEMGLNFSTFFSGLTVNGDEILQAQKYFAFAINGVYKFSSVSSLNLEYLSDNGQEQGTLSGHFIKMAFDRAAINLGEKAVLSANLMLFYIDYDGNNDGFFFSPTISFSIRNIPFVLFFQETQAIQSNIAPWPKFKWNAGISYNL